MGAWEDSDAAFLTLATTTTADPAELDHLIHQLHSGNLNRATMRVADIALIVRAQPHLSSAQVAELASSLGCEPRTSKADEIDDALRAVLEHPAADDWSAALLLHPPLHREDAHLEHDRLGDNLRRPARTVLCEHGHPIGAVMFLLADDPTVSWMGADVRDLIARADTLRAHVAAAGLDLVTFVRTLGRLGQSWDSTGPDLLATTTAVLTAAVATQPTTDPSLSSAGS